MHMITRKKIIAALLIPIMLIAFSTPSFAATSTGFDLSAFAQKALNLTLKVGTASFEIAKEFVSEFMGVNDVGDALELSGNLITTGISSVTELVGIFATASYTPEGILPLLGKLLSFTINTGITFADTLFVADLSNPAGYLPFIGDLLSFSINAGKTLVGVVAGELDLGDLSALVSGSNVDLSGIFDMLVQSNGEIPSTNVSGILENFNTTNVISFLGSIMGGTPEDLLNSGTDIIEGLFNSLTTTDTNKSQVPVDFTEVADDEKEETPNTDKPAINSEPNDNNTNLGEYQYNYNGVTYKIAVTKAMLTSVLNNLATNEALHNENMYDDKSLANVHLKMLLGSLVNNTDFESENVLRHASKRGSLVTLKNCIDDKQPARVKINTNNYLTCVGYTNDGTKFTDFLFIEPSTGKLTTVNDSTYLPDTHDAIWIIIEI